VIVLNFEAMPHSFQVAFVALTGNCAQKLFIIYLLRFVIQNIIKNLELIFLRITEVDINPCLVPIILMDGFLYAPVPDTETNIVLFWFSSFHCKIGKSKELIGLSEVTS
jgi:hypothetical protein